MHMQCRSAGRSRGQSRARLCIAMGPGVLTSAQLSIRNVKLLPLEDIIMNESVMVMNQLVK